MCAGAGSAARSNVSGGERLEAAFWTICQRHEHRLAQDPRLHELVVAAGQANWPVVLSYGDRVRGLVRSIIAAGQASGEFRAGSPMALARCTCEAMGAYLDPSRMRTIAGRAAFDEMMSFCSGALRSAAPARGPRPAAALPGGMPGLASGGATVQGVQSASQAARKNRTRSCTKDGNSRRRSFGGSPTSERNSIGSRIRSMNI